MKEKIIFQETQRFNQWWVYLVMIGLVLVLLLQFNFMEAFLNQLTVDKVMPSIIVGLILVLFLTLKMSTTITEEKILIRYFPFLRKEFLWEELNNSQVIDYGFVGGWGIRLWTDYGTVYNVRGSQGLHIQTADRQYVIGTQKEEKLRSSIAHLLK